eukprot:g19484.t1
MHQSGKTLLVSGVDDASPEAVIVLGPGRFADYKHREEKKKKGSLKRKKNAAPAFVSPVWLGYVLRGRAILVGIRNALVESGWTLRFVVEKDIFRGVERFVDRPDASASDSLGLQKVLAPHLNRKVATDQLPRIDLYKPNGETGVMPELGEPEPEDQRPEVGEPEPEYEEDELPELVELEPEEEDEDTEEVEEEETEEDDKESAIACGGKTPRGPAPAKTKHTSDPAPAKTKHTRNLAPAESKHTSNLAPAESKHTPAKTSTPAPDKTSTPAPAKTSTPAPAKTSTPAPAKKSTPAPAKTSTPAGAPDSMLSPSGRIQREVTKRRWKWSLYRVPPLYKKDGIIGWLVSVGGRALNEGVWLDDRDSRPECQQLYYFDSLSNKRVNPEQYERILRVPGEFTFSQGENLYTLSPKDHELLVKESMHTKYAGALVAHAASEQNLMFGRPRRKMGLPTGRTLRAMDIGNCATITYGSKYRFPGGRKPPVIPKTINEARQLEVIAAMQTPLEVNDDEEESDVTEVAQSTAPKVNHSSPGHHHCNHNVESCPCFYCAHRRRQRAAAAGTRDDPTAHAQDTSSRTSSSASSAGNNSQVVPAADHMSAEVKRQLAAMRQEMEEKINAATTQQIAAGSAKVTAEAEALKWEARAAKAADEAKEANARANVEAARAEVAVNNTARMVEQLLQSRRTPEKVIGSKAARTAAPAQATGVSVPHDRVLSK